MQSAVVAGTILVRFGLSVLLLYRFGGERSIDDVSGTCVQKQKS